MFPDPRHHNAASPRDACWARSLSVCLDVRDCRGRCYPTMRGSPTRPRMRSMMANSPPPCTARSGEPRACWTSRPCAEVLDEFIDAGGRPLRDVLETLTLSPPASLSRMIFQGWGGALDLPGGGDWRSTRSRQPRGIRPPAIGSATVERLRRPARRHSRDAPHAGSRRATPGVGIHRSGGGAPVHGMIPPGRRRRARISTAVKSRFLGCVLDTDARSLGARCHSGAPETQGLRRADTGGGSCGGLGVGGG